MSKHQILPAINSRSTDFYSKSSEVRFKGKYEHSEDSFGSVYNSVKDEELTKAEKNSARKEKSEKDEDKTREKEQLNGEDGKESLAAKIHRLQQKENEGAKAASSEEGKAGDEKNNLAENTKTDNSGGGTNTTSGETSVGSEGEKGNAGNVISSGSLANTVQETDSSDGQSESSNTTVTTDSSGAVETLSTESGVNPDKDSEKSKMRSGLRSGNSQGMTPTDGDEVSKRVLKSGINSGMAVENEEKKASTGNSGVGKEARSVVNGRGSSDGLSEEQKRTVDALLNKEKGVHTFKGNVAVSSVGTEQVGKKKQEEKRLPSFANSELRTDRRSELGLTSSEKSNPLSQIDFKGIGNTLTSTFDDFNADEDELMWKQHMAESVESKEVKAADQQKSSYMRLGQIPVSNVSIRRNMLPGLTQTVLKAANQAKAAPETWQKHNFVLDDGKKVHLSAREVNGVLQLKIGSMHSDLNKLLQQHQHQIRQHLEQECGLEIDLQFESNEEQSMSEFFNDSSSSKHGRQGSRIKTNDKASPQKIEQVLLKSVRKFGYNEMEWTA